MKPLKLTMQAFGSYGKKTTIDFEEPNQNLFLITGDTGAGKTTIFDAIVFALYGEASSTANKKNGVVLQSQFAMLDVEPYVELTFSDGYGMDCSIYKVTRIPRHLKPVTRGAAKGTRTREIVSSVSLMMPDGAEYPAKEIDKKLEEIVGLTKNQFMQVAMIAQGEFMEILREKSDKKKDIFRKLFNTELFQKIVDELHKRAHDKSKELAVIKTQCQTVIARMTLPENYEYLEEIENLKEKIANEELSFLEQFLEKMKVLCEHLKKEKENAEKEFALVDKDRDKKRDAYTNAQNVLKFFEQYDLAEKELAECKSKEEEIKEKTTLITRLRAAYDIQGEYQRYMDVKKRVVDTQTALEQQQNRLPKLQTASEEAAHIKEQSQKKYELALENFNKISEKAEKALNLFEQLSKETETVKKNEEGLKEAETQAQNIQKEKADIETKTGDWKKQMEQYENIDAQYARWEGICKDVSILNEEAEELIKLQKEVEQQEVAVEQSQNDYKKVKDSYNQKNNEYESKRQAFLDAQAGFLAKELEDGKPCPVCGSLEHPNPCSCEEAYDGLTEEIINELRQEVDKLRSTQQNLSEDSKAKMASLEEKQLSLERGLEKLRQRMEQSMDSLPEPFSLKAAQSHIKDCRRKLELQGRQMKENIRKRDKIQGQLQSIDEMKAQLEVRENEANEKLSEAKVALESSKAKLQNLEASKEYSSKAEAEKVLKEAEKNKADYERIYREAEKTASEKKQEKDNSETLIHKYSEELPEQEEQCRQRESAYENIMQQKKLPESEWKSLTKEYPAAAPETFQKEVEEYNNKLAAAKNMKQSATEAIGEQKRPVMEEIKKEMEDAEQRRKIEEEKFEKAKEIYKVDSAVYEELSAKRNNRQKIVGEYTKLNGLYQMLSGNVSGSRMDIETFVQRYYLDKILYAANQRFLDMSAGQYELRLMQLEKAGEGKNKGLDLMVYSNVTGKEREVRTLSGGESFMAALALALGMADQIQENSAAINLDIMFIDEGFGSLDEHSRNQAVKVLLEMAEGSKLIGIISHVTELKQQIDNQLLVSKNEDGSCVDWQIS